MPTKEQLEIKNRIKDMGVGDRISCDYIATEGELGCFMNLGESNSDLIPPQSSAEPNGKFYFIKVDNNKLIADRNIQHGISWNSLNSKGIVDGIPFQYERKSRVDGSIVGDVRYEAADNNIILTIPDGGVAYLSDKEGQLLVSEVFPIEPMTSYENDKCRVSASSEWDPSSGQVWKIFNCTNENDWDGWHTKSESNPWILMEFSEEIEISGYECINRNNSSFADGNTPKSCSIYGSHDGEYFELIDKSTFTNRSANGVNRILFRQKVKYRYYRMNFESSVHTFISILRLLNCELFVPAYSFVNNNLGAWPPDNEWDKYILKGDLAGRVTPSDNNIWNYSEVASICKNKSLPEVVQIEGGQVSIPPGQAKIITRGYVDQYINDDSAKRLNTRNSSGSSETMGFRPMLVIKGGE